MNRAREIEMAASNGFALPPKVGPWMGRLAKVCLGVVFAAVLMETPAWAWNPPDGPFDDVADPPPSPNGLIRKGHGYIGQNGIAILHNDGYWFAASELRQWQQEILNGLRYADVYQGRQQVEVELCAFFGHICKDLWTAGSWPLAADQHYFNPDTGQGYNPGNLDEIDFWLGVVGLLPTWVINAGTLTAGLDIDVRPPFQSVYTSALQLFETKYEIAKSAYLNPQPDPGIRGRTGRSLAMFYLGWSSHLMQDLGVVHHTFDEGLKHHSEYENAADGFVATVPVADGRRTGIYAAELPTWDCASGQRSCFGSYAAYFVHDAMVLQGVDNGDYTAGLEIAIPLVQRLQAGLYAAFLTDVGKPPVHMSAVMSALVL